MLTLSPAPPQGGSWALRIALIFSLLFHLAVYVAGTFGYDAVARAVDPAGAPRVAVAPEQTETVTVVHPLVLEHRRQAPPAGLPAPRPHVRAPRGFTFPRLAFATGDAGAAARRPQEPNAAQLAFARALERNERLAARAPLTDPARVPERYRMHMQGRRAKLVRGQGIYFPTRGWRENGLDYYDVSYEFVHPDGVDEQGAVPWPIHFEPARDPFFSPDFQALSRTPLPRPPPGFVPPGDLGKALRAYFPDLHFEDADG